MIARIFLALVIVFGCEAMPLILNTLKIPPDNTGTLQVMRVLILGITFGVLASSKPSEEETPRKTRPTIQSNPEDSFLRLKELLTPNQKEPPPAKTEEPIPEEKEKAKKMEVPLA